MKFQQLVLIASLLLNVGAYFLNIISFDQVIILIAAIYVADNILFSPEQ